MAYYPTSTSGLNYISYPVGPNATNNGVTITAAGSNNTKGSYTEVIASTAFECNWAEIMVNGTSSSAGRQYLWDLATGAGGAETIIVPNIMAQGGFQSVRSGAGMIPLPLKIAASTRIAARCQCSTASTTLQIAIILRATGDMEGIDSYTNYGADTATSGGVAIDPGGSANTKGAYSEITSSTSAITQYIIKMGTTGGNTQPASVLTLYDIATGAAASEVVLIPDLYTNHYNGGGVNGLACWQPMAHAMATYIAASTRIAIRASCSITDATDRLSDVVIIVGTAPAEASGGEHSAVF